MTDHTLFLSNVNDVWQDHCEHMLTIRSIFLYLDRSFVIQTPNIVSIWDMGLHLFRHHLQLRHEVESKTISGLLGLIEKERDGETVGGSSLSIFHLFKKCIYVYEE